MNLVREMIGYKPRINNKNDAKCMDTYLKDAPESELVITMLGSVKDYLPVEAPLLDYLATDIEGPTGGNVLVRYHISSLPEKSPRRVRGR